MITLWMKAFRSPSYLSLEGEEGAMEKRKELVMDGLRAYTRDGTMVGHMPICWGVLCGVLGLSLGELVPSFSRRVPRSLFAPSITPETASEYSPSSHSPPFSRPNPPPPPLPPRSIHPLLLRPTQPNRSLPLPIPPPSHRSTSHRQGG